MVEPIQSREVFGQVEVSLGEAPKHTHPDHVECAYYVITQEVAPDVADRIFIEMECPHGFSAGGAFYSEDYVRQLKTSFSGHWDKAYSHWHTGNFTSCKECNP